MNSIPLKLDHLSKHYGSLKAVEQVSFEMKSGEIFGLLGPNGAGKTSIISTIVTLEEPTAGKVEVFGVNVVDEPIEAKRMIGFVPQELIHHGYFDVYEILTFHSGYFGRLRNKERIDYLLNKLGLWEHRNKKVKQLSGGMKRRLLIAKSLVNEPKLLLLDEPTAGVDIELRESLWKFVLELKAAGLSILLTTHYLEEAQTLCDRVGVLNKGTLKRLDKTENLIKGLTKRIVTLKLRQAHQLEHPTLISTQENTFVFEIPSSMVVGDLLGELKIQAHEILDLQIREGTLEEALKRALKE